MLQGSNSRPIGRSMSVGDLVRLTSDGLVAAWYPDTDRDAVGIVIALPAQPEEWVTVEWPFWRDTHMLQDLEIIKSFS